MRPSRAKGVPVVSVGVRASSLPETIVGTLNKGERDLLEPPYRAFVDGGCKDMMITGTLQPDASVLVSIIFKDCIGSLGAICATLGSQRVAILRVHAFTTADGTAVDLLHVSSFANETEKVLRSCLEKKILDATSMASDGLTSLPESYAYVTTPAERDAHRRMCIPAEDMNPGLRPLPLIALLPCRYMISSMPVPTP